MTNGPERIITENQGSVTRFYRGLAAKRPGWNVCSMVGRARHDLTGISDSVMQVGKAENLAPLHYTPWGWTSALQNIWRDYEPFP